MKLIKKLIMGSVLASTIVAAHAAIVLPSTGDGELIAVLSNPDGLLNFTFDLGYTLSTFDTTQNQTFNLASSPYYESFLAAYMGSPNLGPIKFAVFGADSAGSITLENSKKLFITSMVGSTPPAPTNASLNNIVGNANTFLATLNPPSSLPSQGNHATMEHGSSLEVGGNNSYIVLNANVFSPARIYPVTAGDRAELFSITTAQGTTTTLAKVTDFFSDTETTSNTGAYFDLDASTGVLSYVGAPVVTPIPEASEWAMMLSGLAMVALVGRRRRSDNRSR
jgi:hypothetical protein